MNVLPAAAAAMMSARNGAVVVAPETAMLQLPESGLRMQITYGCPFCIDTNSVVVLNEESIWLPPESVTVHVTELAGGRTPVFGW